MKLLLTGLFICLLISPAMALEPDTIWTKIYKPDADDYSDKIYAGCMTSDGAMVFNGYCDSYQWWNGQQYLIKINTDGDTVWTANFGTVERDYGWGIVETYDQGLAICGFGRVASSSEDYRARLFKADSQGNELWGKAYYGSTDLNAYGLTETADSGFAIVGYTGAYGDYDMFLLRTDSVGDSLWMKTYGGGADEEGGAVAQTDDGGFMLVGHTASFGAGREDIYIVRTDAVGDTLWTFTFGDTSIDAAYAIEKTSAGDFVVAGYSIYPADPPEQRMILIRIQDDGDTLWTTSILGGQSSQAYAVCEANDGGFIMTGKARYNNNTDIGIAKVSSDGDSLWIASYGGALSDEGWFVCQDQDDYIYVGGTHSWNSSGDYYALKLTDGAVDIADYGDKLIPSEFALYQNSPNPFNAGTAIEYYVPYHSNVTITVYNLLGQNIRTLVDGKMSVGNYTAQWDGTDNSGQSVGSGVYFYQLSVNDFSMTKKMVYLK